MITKEELATKLNGRQYGDEITPKEESEAKSSGLVVVFGGSDDLAEFRGAIHDEAGCGGREDEILIDTRGEIREWKDVRDEVDEEAEAQNYFDRKRKAIKVTAWWDRDGYSFTFGTELAFSTFDIFDDCDKYCRGIVFNLPT